MYVGGMLSGDYLTVESGICIPYGPTLGFTYGIQQG